MEKWVGWFLAVFAATALILTEAVFITTPDRKETERFWITSNTEILNEGQEVTVEKFTIEDSGSDDFKIVKRYKEIKILTREEVVKMPLDVFKKITRDGSLKVYAVITKNRKTVEVFYLAQVARKIYLTHDILENLSNKFLIQVKNVRILGKNEILTSLSREVGFGDGIAIAILSISASGLVAIFIDEGKTEKAFWIETLLLALYLVFIYLCT